MAMEALAAAREIEGASSRAQALSSIVKALIEAGMMTEALAAARAGQQRALQSAAREIRMRVPGGRANLYHVIEVQPWSRLPERRYALIDYEP